MFYISIQKGHMVQNKFREVTIKESGGKFSIFKENKTSKKDYDFSGLLALRQLLSNERARILNVIKTQNPTSIYNLSKILQREFKSVQTDIKLLERFGLVELIKEKTKGRICHKPVLIADSLTININF
jgi:predicted transcriptional regulator